LQYKELDRDTSSKLTVNEFASKFGQSEFYVADRNEDGVIDFKEFHGYFGDCHWSDIIDNMIGGFFYWYATDYFIRSFYDRNVSVVFLVLLNVLSILIFEIADHSLHPSKFSIVDSLMSVDTLEDTSAALLTAFVALLFSLYAQNKKVGAWIFILLGFSLPFFLVVKFNTKPEYNTNGGLVDNLDNFLGGLAVLTTAAALGSRSSSISVVFFVFLSAILFECLQVIRGEVSPESSGYVIDTVGDVFCFCLPAVLFFLKKNVVDPAARVHLKNVD